MIDRQVSHMVRLVDDLLDVSRITRGKITLKSDPVELASVVASAVESSRPFIDARCHDLHVELPAEPVHVKGDLTRLAQVVLNLLNNSAKYTPEGGHIWLSVAQDDRQAVIRVRDDGVGIVPELLPKVFDLFTQAERTLDRSQGGLGIGLTLVKTLTELHGGSVEARSAGAGRGSEFVVRLPLLSDELHAGKQGGDGRADGPGSSVPRRILVVDDNVDAADSLAMLLGAGATRCGRRATAGKPLRLRQSTGPTWCSWTLACPAWTGTPWRGNCAHPGPGRDGAGRRDRIRQFRRPSAVGRSRLLRPHGQAGGIRRPRRIADGPADPHDKRKGARRNLNVPTRKSIWVVDDDEANRESLALRLSEDCPVVGVAVLGGPRSSTDDTGPS